MNAATASLAVIALTPALVATAARAQAATGPQPRPSLALSARLDTQDLVTGDASPLEQTRSPWRVEVTTWIWLMGVEGDVGARGRVADVSANFGDILDASDSIVALSGRVEVGYGRWAAYVDGFYADIGVDDASGPLGLASVDVTMEQVIVDFGVMYRIGEWEPEGGAAGNPRDIALDVYAGGRYSDVDIDMDPAMLASFSGGSDWLDPIVGARLTLPLSERWHLRVGGDVGGFGVESDFTWSATGVLGCDFRIFDAPAVFYVGYRAIGWDYSEGSGASKLTWDVIEHGPLLGFGLQW